MKYEVVFFSSINEEETTVKQKFDSITDANKWATEYEYDYQDIAIDEDGNDYWKTIYRYYKLALDGTKKQVNEKLQNKLNLNKDVLKLNKQLVTICTYLDINTNDTKVCANFIELKEMFKKYQFKSLLNNFNEFIMLFQNCQKI